MVILVESRASTVEMIKKFSKDICTIVIALTLLLDQETRFKYQNYVVDIWTLIKLLFKPDFLRDLFLRHPRYYLHFHLFPNNFEHLN